MKPSFLVSYRGAADYEVGSQVVEVRYRGHNYGYNTGVWESDIKPAIGTIRNRSDIRAWPSAEACAAFPGAIPTRWNHENNRFEYRDGISPRLEPDPIWSENGRVESLQAADKLHLTEEN